MNALADHRVRRHEILQRLCATRPLLARLSGSGSALVTICRTERDRDAAAREIGERGHRLLRTMTRALPAAGPVVG